MGLAKHMNQAGWGEGVAPGMGVSGACNRRGGTVPEAFRPASLATGPGVRAHLWPGRLLPAALAIGPWTCEPPVCIQAYGLLSVTLTRAPVYLLDEAAGTGARGPGESLLTPVRHECELTRQPRELDGGSPGPVRYPGRTSGRATPWWGSAGMCATGLADERFEGGAQVGPGYLGVATFDGTVQARFNVVGEDDLRGGIEGSAHGRDLSQELGALPPGLGHASHGLQMTGRAGEAPADVVPGRVRVQLGRGCVVGVAVVPMRIVGCHGSIGGNTRARAWSLHPGHSTDCRGTNI